MAVASLAASAAISLVGSVARSVAPSSRSAGNYAAPVEDSAVMAISQAARDRLAAEANRPEAGDMAVYDTSQGSQSLDIDAYFTPDPSRPLLSIPLLAPTRNNIDALSRHVSAKMPDLLARYGIPQAPSSITYDAYGKMELPADYRYAEQFRTAMSENPVLARQLSTVNALSSQMTGMEKAMSFDQAYRAAKTPAEIEAVIARFRHLLNGNAPATSIALHFDSAGRLSVSADGKALPTG